MKPDAIVDVAEQKEDSNQPEKRRLSRKALLLLTMSLGILILLGFALGLIRYRKPTVNDLLTTARLTELPESIENLTVDTCPQFVRMRSGLKTIPNRRSLFIRFQAESNVISNFIASSPALRQGIRFRPNQKTYEDRKSAPIWWRPEQGRLGRECGISRRSYITGGCVLIDDENNTVRILVNYVVHPHLEGAMTSLARLKKQTVGVIGGMSN